MFEIPSKNSRQTSLRFLYVSDVPEELFRGLVVSAKALGFEYFSYLIGVPQTGQQCQFAMVSNFPKAWQDQYRRHAYFSIDPTLQHAKTNASSLNWTPDIFDRTLLKDLSRDARSIGLNFGWTQPIHEATGEFGVLTLSRSEGAISAEELDEKSWAMHWLACVTHIVFFRMLRSRQKNEAIVQLTQRELQFLRMTADGKTAAEISAELGVTERTANFHIGNVIGKLNAANKAHAVALAIRLGLID